MNACKLFVHGCSRGLPLFVAATLVISTMPPLAFAENEFATVDDIRSDEPLAAPPDSLPPENEILPEDIPPADGEASLPESENNPSEAPSGEASGEGDEDTSAGPVDSGSVSTMTEEEIAEVLQPLSAPVPSLLSNDADAARVAQPVAYLYGKDRYETAAAEALYAYPSGCTTVIVASGVGNAWADALSATGLAGALNCPILFATAGSIPQVTSDAITQLGASKVILIGGENAISSSTEASLGSLSGVSSVQRVWGTDRYVTQLAIYEFGLKGYDGSNHWSNDMVLVASGAKFPDALSASSLAFSKRVPMFLVGEDGNLPLAQKQALIKAQKSGASSFATSVVLGREAAVSRQTEGFMWAVSQIGSGASKATVRLGGETRFETSAAFAQWCVDRQYLSWDKAAFVSGVNPWDALAGSVVQGKDNSVMLLAGTAYDAPVAKAVANASVIDGVKFFGGDGVISATVKADILFQIFDVAQWNCGITLDAMASAEVNSEANKLYKGYTREQVLEYLDPSHFLYGTAGYYQYARLTDGYSNKVTAAQLDTYISSVDKGATGKLAGMGQSFVTAAQQTGVNEVYLLAHAILESGWGTSDLAMGYSYAGGEIDGKTYPAGTYYNFFGIGAFDSSALSGGRKMAIINGWDTPEKAIIGAAQWIKREYLANGYGPQNSLYKMKWDFYHARLGQDPWKQYATDRTWAYGIATVMAECYNRNGIAINDSGLTFEYPKYN